MIDLHLFALNCNESFRIVVDEKEKRAKLTLTGLSYTPNCGCKGTAFFGICKYSLYFFTLKVHLFMQGIDETNKSIPYIQRETYWCVF